MMTHRPKLLSGLFLLTVAAVGLLAATPAAAEDINRIILRVNNQIVTLQEYEARKSSELTRILANPNLTPNDRQTLLERVGQETLQSFFGELLLLSFAEQQGIRVRDSEVDNAVLEMQRQQGIESREDLETALAASGLTYDQLRENTRREMIWSQVVSREVNGRINIGEEELRAYYRNNLNQFEVPERRRLQEIIVLESSGLPTDELAQKADQIHRQLTAGVDINELVEEHKATGLTTGIIDLDWLEKKELETALADVAWQLEAGQFSAPVQARGGFHILQLTEIEESTILPYEEVESLIRRRERGQRFQKELRNFLNELEEMAYIVENLPAEAVGYRSMADDFEADDELGIFFSPLANPEAEGAEGGEGE